jgi:hypothetical protein
MNNYLLYFLCLSSIFIGAVFYTLASFYHLKMDKNWTFFKAILIALPFVLIEYTFTLHGIFYSYKFLDLKPSQILIITICFYFICIWIFNYFVMKIRLDRVHMLKEIFAFLLIIIAFYISNVIH